MKPGIIASASPGTADGPFLLRILLGLLLSTIFSGGMAVAMAFPF
jgi:hypothetical protein